MLSTLKEMLAKRVLNATAGGFGDNIDSTAVDLQTQHAEHIEFQVLLGTIAATGTATAKAQHSDDNVTYTDITGASVAIVDTDDNKVARIMVHKPMKRYIRCRVSRATANVAIDAVMAMLFGKKNVPVTQDATVVATTAEIAVAV